MFINLICINAKVNSSKIKNYIEQSFKLKLEPGNVDNHIFVFGERLGSKETVRKEYIKYITLCQKKIMDIATLKNKKDICIINTYTKDKYHLHIKGYKCNGYRVERLFEDIYESKYLESYIAKVEKGIIDYSVYEKTKNNIKSMSKKDKKRIGRCWTQWRQLSINITI